MTPWVMRLIIANVLSYVVVQQGTPLYAMLTLFPPAVIGIDNVYYPAMPFRPWTLVTYMFLHAGIGHIFFNMIALYFFGPRLEARLGSRAFLALYFLSGLGGAVLMFLFSFTSLVVGASGAVFGILIGFAMYWPDERIYIWGILPVPARILVAFLVATSLYSGFSGSGGRVAYFAHIGGLAAGFLFLRYHDWHVGKDRREFARKMNATPSDRTSDRAARDKWSMIDVSGLHELNRSEVEELLRRVEAEGPASLSKDERAFLDRMVGE